MGGVGNEAIPQWARVVRMRPIYELIPVGAHDVLVRSPDQGVRVNVRGLTAAEIASFLGELDGTRPLAAVLEGRAEHDGLLALVEGLIAREIADTSGGPALPEAARFFGHFHDDPLECAARLHDARVVVYGAEPLAESMASALRDAGMDGVTRHAQALGGDHPGEPGGIAAAVAGDLERLAARCRDRDLLVVCGSVDGHSVEEPLNAVALARGIPWLLVRTFGAEGRVGPLFTPRDGPCHTCLRAREEANWADRALTAAYVERLARDARSVTAYGRSPALDALVAAWAAVEVTKWVTGFTVPAVLGALLRIEPVAAATQLHRVLRVPRCPSCSPAAERPSVDALLYGRGR